MHYSERPGWVPEHHQLDYAETLADLWESADWCSDIYQLLHFPSGFGADGRLWGDGQTRSPVCSVLKAWQGSPAAEEAGKDENRPVLVYSNILTWLEKTCVKRWMSGAEWQSWNLHWIRSVCHFQMSKVLAVMGLNWLYWRDLVAGIMVPRRHLAAKPGRNRRLKQLFAEQRGLFLHHFRTEMCCS